MRIYIPVTEMELANREIRADLGFMDNQELREACPVADWDTEEYEDLAMTQAAMYCLLNNEFDKFGRIVLAVEMTEIGEQLPYPGAVQLISPPKWQQVVSVHIDEEKIKRDCQKLQQALSSNHVKALLSGEPELELTDTQMQSWDDLLAEYLCWYEPSELDKLRV